MKTHASLPLIHLRIARPFTNKEAILRFYRDGLGLEVLGKFEDHEGFDGMMLGRARWPFHLEFTIHKGSPILPSPTPEDLLVLYVPDHTEWCRLIRQMETIGYEPVKSFNPYWDKSGRTFQDDDGYRLVIQNANSPVSGTI